MRALVVYMLLVCIGVSLVQHWTRQTVRPNRRHEQIEQLMEEI